MHWLLHDLYAVLWLATWGNNMAWLESLVVIGLVTFLKRDAIGKRAAAFWARHHREHAIEQHMEAQRRLEAEKRGNDDD
jgi:hypothetical protein